MLTWLRCNSNSCRSSYSHSRCSCSNRYVPIFNRPAAALLLYHARIIPLQMQALSGNLGMVAGRKQREVYVGNLTIGVVTDVMLKELFNGALAHLVPDPAGNPPVVNAQLDPSGVPQWCSPLLSLTRHLVASFDTCSVDGAVLIALIYSACDCKARLHQNA